MSTFGTLMKNLFFIFLVDNISLKKYKKLEKGIHNALYKKIIDI